jgi:hypothetical protein
MTARHPFQDAFTPLVGNAAADGISEAIEVYAPLVVFDVTDITSRSLARTQHVVLISGESIRFYKYDAANTDPEDLETVILDLDDRPFVLVERGDRYDLIFSATGAFASAEKLTPIAIVTPITLPATLPGSLAYCLTAPTAQAIFTFEKSTDSGATWSSAFTVTFSAAARGGTFTLAADLDLAAGTLLRPQAPASADATLAGFVCTVAATR